MESAQQSVKRKRDDEAGAGNSSASKRIREEDADVPMDAGVQADLEPTSLKRDRENATVVVKNLPKQTSETRIRQYFRDVSFIPSSCLCKPDFLTVWHHQQLEGPSRQRCGLCNGDNRIRI